jgi:hypothetical protein
MTTDTVEALLPREPSDEQLLSLMVNAIDRLDVTRVHEHRGGHDWHATTIFDGDAGLVAAARSVHDAALASAPKGADALDSSTICFNGRPYTLPLSVALDLISDVNAEIADAVKSGKVPWDRASPAEGTDVPDWICKHCGGARPDDGSKWMCIRRWDDDGLCERRASPAEGEVTTGETATVLDLRCLGSHSLRDWITKVATRAADLIESLARERDTWRFAAEKSSAQIGLALDDLADANAEHAGLRAKLAERDAVLDAAMVWAFCPSAGGYKDGPAVEDTCEALGIAVNAALGVDLDSPSNLWWTIDEMRAAVISAQDAEGGKT